MTDKEILDFIQKRLEEEAFFEIDYTPWDGGSVTLRGDRHDGYGNTIREAAEDYKKKIEGE